MEKLTVLVYQSNLTDDTNVESNESKPQEVNDVETQKLLKEMQKTIDILQKDLQEEKEYHEDIKVYLENLKKDREAIVTNDFSDIQALTNEVKELKQVNIEHYAWFVYCVVGCFGVLVLYYIYRMLRRTF